MDTVLLDREIGTDAAAGIVPRQAHWPFATNNRPL